MPPCGAADAFSLSPWHKANRSTSARWTTACSTFCSSTQVSGAASTILKRSPLAHTKARANARAHTHIHMQCRGDLARGQINRHERGNEVERQVNRHVCASPAVRCSPPSAPCSTGSSSSASSSILHTHTHTTYIHTYQRPTARTTRKQLQDHRCNSCNRRAHLCR